VFGIPSIIFGVFGTFGERSQKPKAYHYLSMHNKFKMIYENYLECQMSISLLNKCNYNRQKSKEVLAKRNGFGSKRFK
jgi:hypothetical protein